MTAAHERGAHVAEAPQPPVSARAAGHVEDAQCALTVDASRLGERQIEPNRGGAVNDVRRRPYQTVERSPVYAEVVRGHVTADRVHAVAHGLPTLVAEEPGDHLVQPSGGPLLVARTDHTRDLGR